MSTTFDLNELFTLVGNSTLRLPSRDLVEAIFNDMAYKLIEEYDVLRSDLRDIFADHDFVFEEFCSDCNERIDDTDAIDPEDNEPLCDDCTKG